MVSYGIWGGVYIGYDKHFCVPVSSLTFVKLCVEMRTMLPTCSFALVRAVDCGYTTSKLVEGLMSAGAMRVARCFVLL